MSQRQNYCQRWEQVHQQLLFVTETIAKKLNQNRVETFWLRYLSLSPVGSGQTFFWDLIPRDGFWSGRSIRSYEARWKREFSHLAKKYYLSQKLIDQLLEFKCHSGSFCTGYHTGNCNNKAVIGYGNYNTSANSWLGNLFT